MPGRRRWARSTWSRRWGAARRARRNAALFCVSILLRRNAEPDGFVRHADAVSPAFSVSFSSFSSSSARGRSTATKPCFKARRPWRKPFDHPVEVRLGHRVLNGAALFEPALDVTSGNGDISLWVQEPASLGFEPDDPREGGMMSLTISNKKAAFPKENGLKVGCGARI
jgi:hypothetical protein